MLFTVMIIYLNVCFFFAVPMFCDESSALTSLANRIDTRFEKLHVLVEICLKYCQFKIEIDNPASNDFIFEYKTKNVTVQTREREKGYRSVHK